jgi:hypothetical protein
MSTHFIPNISFLFIGIVFFVALIVANAFTAPTGICFAAIGDEIDVSWVETAGIGLVDLSKLLDHNSLQSSLKNENEWSLYGGNYCEIKSLYLPNGVLRLISDGGEDSIWASSPIQAVPGSRYRLVCNIKTEGVGIRGGAFFRIEWYDAINCYITGLSSKKIVGNSDWSEVAFEGYVPLDAKSARILFVLDGPGNAYYDFVQFRLLNGFDGDTPSDIAPGNAVMTLNPEVNKVYAWIRNEGIRGAYFYSDYGQEHFKMLSTTGLNSALVKVTAIERINGALSSQGMATIARTADAARANGMRFFLISNFVGNEEASALGQRFRKYVDENGKELPQTPCPLDRFYWNCVLLGRGEQLAQLNKGSVLIRIMKSVLARGKDEPRVAGLVLDTEMYGANISTYSQPCFCDSCFKGYMAVLDREDVTLDASSRQQWLISNDYYYEYIKYLEKKLAELVGNIIHKIHDMDSGLMVGFLNYHIDSWFFRALAHGMGTPSMPALIFPEQPSYSRGYTPSIHALQYHLIAEKANAIVIPGLDLHWFQPKYLTMEAYQLAMNSSGYWLFTTYSIDADPKMLTGAYRVPGHSDEYWNALAKANSEVDQAMKTVGYSPALSFAKQPSIVFIDEDGTGFSQEVLLPLFADKVELPVNARSTIVSGYQMYYVHLKAGDTLEFSMDVVQRGGRKDPGYFEVWDPCRDFVIKGYVPAGKTRTVKAVVEMEGIYQIQTVAGTNAYSVEINNVNYIHLADSRKKFRPSTYVEPMYFKVPENISSFTVFIHVPDTSTKGRIRIYDSVDNLILEKHDYFNQATALPIDVLEGSRGEIWRLELDAGPGSSGVPSTVLYFSNNMPPYLANHPKRLLGL